MSTVAGGVWECGVKVLAFCESSDMVFGVFLSIEDRHLNLYVTIVWEKGEGMKGGEDLYIQN